MTSNFTRLHDPIRNGFLGKLPRYAGVIFRAARQSGITPALLAAQAKRRGAAQKITEFAAFASFVRSRRPRIVVEIGTLNGGTFWALCRVAHHRAELFSVDLPGASFSGGYDQEADQRIQQYARRGQKIHLIRGDSHADKTLEQLDGLLEGRLVDLLFIDGDHSYEGVKRDFQMYGPLVAPGGLIAFHDILPHANPECQVDQLWAQVRSNGVHWEFTDTSVDPRNAWGGIGVLAKA